MFIFNELLKGVRTLLAIRATVSINVRTPVPAANAMCTPVFSRPKPLPNGPEMKYGVACIS